MKLHKNQLLWGCIAAVTLALWFSAQFVCARHCASGQLAANADAAHACCKKGDGAAPESPAPMPDGGSCFVFKTAPATGSQQLVAPIEFWQPLLAFVFLSFEPLVPTHSAILNRPLAPDRCVIAHEVSLGSAAHSLAPPLLA